MSAIRVMFGLLGRGGLERLLHRPSGCVRDMDDPAVAVAAFAGQVERIAFGRERHPQLHQPRDCPRSFGDDMLDDPPVV
jgi:hypothetical protein